MGLPLLDWQTSLVALLKGDPVLSTVGWRVYDYVPPDRSEVNYITVGDDESTPWDRKSSSTVDGGQELLERLHFWSTARGRKTVKEAMDRVHSLMHEKPMAVQGYDVVVQRCEFSNVIKDPDGVTLHGIMRFRSIIVNHKESP